MRVLSAEERAAVEALGLTESQFHDIDSRLANNEEDPDEEIIELLSEIGVPEHLIRQALGLRDAAMIDPFCQLAVVEGKLALERMPGGFTPLG